MCATCKVLIWVELVDGTIMVQHTEQMISFHTKLLNMFGVKILWFVSVQCSYKVD
jgi:hypothetical protein